MEVTASKKSRRSRAGGNLDRAPVMANPLILNLSGFPLNRQRPG